MLQNGNEKDREAARIAIVQEFVHHQGDPTIYLLIADRALTSEHPDVVEAGRWIRRCYEQQHQMENRNGL